MIFWWISTNCERNIAEWWWIMWIEMIWWYWINWLKGGKWIWITKLNWLNTPSSDHPNQTHVSNSKNFQPKSDPNHNYIICHSILQSTSPTFLPVWLLRTTWCDQPHPKKTHDLTVNLQEICVSDGGHLETIAYLGLPQVFYPKESSVPLPSLLTPPFPW
jgi:hypothetical protein